MNKPIPNDNINQDKKIAELLKKKHFDNQDIASLFATAFLLGLETAKNLTSTLKDKPQISKNSF
ncbi:MAG: hypothetical protein IJ728_11945 [Selenomonadaceae bacterium]|nr:hypothetical protein [Selenomonadaceae bacterium]